MKEEELIERLAELEMIVDCSALFLCKLFKDSQSISGNIAVLSLPDRETINQAIACHVVAHEYWDKYEDTLIEKDFRRKDRLYQHIQRLMREQDG